MQEVSVVEASAWSDLLMLVPLNGRDICDVSVMARPWRNVEDVAMYIEEEHMMQTLLQELITRYVNGTVRAMLKECVDLSEDDWRILNSPRGFVGSYDDQEVRYGIADHFSDRVNAESPPWIIRSMMAVIDFGMGDMIAASRSAKFAMCERQVKHFGHFLDASHKIAVDAMLYQELQLANVLAELITSRRR